MKYFFLTLLFSFSSLTVVFAEDVGSAGGKGVIERFIVGDPEGKSEQMPFSPKYSFAYKEGSGKDSSTWIVLSDHQPPVKELIAAKDPAEARRQWCEKDKAAFVALKLDSVWAVDLYFLCPANGNVNTEMLSSANGLDSIVVKLETKTDSKLKGTITGGEGSCPDSDGNNKYCTEKSNYIFDAPIIR